MWINTRLHCKIWFSEEPEVFLNLENRLRFIRDLKKNPEAKFTFLYSSALLSKAALTKLTAFCTLHDIIPLDFDTQVEPLLVEEEDKEFFRWAKEELLHIKNNKGGNTAAASDLVRAITPIIEIAGNYADFDDRIDFSQKREWLRVKFPVVLNISYTPDNQPIVNINAMFVARDKDTGKVVNLAKERLRLVKRSVLEQYANPLRQFIGFGPIPLVNSQKMSRLVSLLTFFHESSFDKDIFGFRSFLKANPLLSSLYDRTVTNISGATNYKHLFLIPACGSPAPKELPRILAEISNAGFEANDIADCITTKNLGSIHSLCSAETIGKQRDGSWTPLGKTRMKERENALHNSGKAICTAWKTWKENGRPRRVEAQLVPKDERSVSNADYRSTRFE